MFQHLRITLLLLLLTPVLFFAQTGTVNGKITDSESGQNIVGANILVVGTAFGSVSDLDGKYLIKKLKMGTYQLKVSIIGYTSKTITNVVVDSNKVVTINVNLSQETIVGDEVVITAQKQLSTESALLSERKKSASIGDGISMEQVKRTPDATSSDVLKRITGVSIVDNKFVFVRGVTDRYNATTLNGSSVTSTNVDADRGSFAFDMIPSNLIENINVTKTATPDLPGDFTGGLVQINTLDFPEKAFYKISITQSYNDITTFKDIRLSNGGGNRDWLGYDDGARKFPEGNERNPNLGKLLPNTWAQRSSSGPMNQSYNLTVGDVFDDDDIQFGYIGSLSYSNNYQRNQLNNAFPKINLFAQGTKDVHSVLLGTLLDLNVKIGRFHKISVKNNFNQTGDEKVSNIIQENDEVENHKDIYVTQWTERSSYLAQAIGDHSFPELGGITFGWRGSYNKSNAYEPDMRTIVYARNIRAPESDNAMYYSLRSWAILKEQTRNGGIDFSIPVSNAKIKFGGLADVKTRNYGVNFYQVEVDRLNGNYALGLLPIDKIFAHENFGPGKMVMNQLSSIRDEYDGRFILYAAYGMLDVPFTLFSENFRFTGGVRMENNEQKVNTIDPEETNKPLTVRTKVVDYLPSVNFTYLFNEVTNLRFAYSNSVDRPEFRELANFYFYDYTILEGKFGNPKLARSLSRNSDIRFEIYPNVGELFAISYFYKSISNAIEEQLLAGSNPERTWYNAKNGKNFGYEIELRKSFDFFDFIDDYFRNFSLVGNYTKITSKIDYAFSYKAPDGSGNDITEIRQREMQGQSPFVYNVSFLFQEPTLGTSINILYNVFGRKLDAVADYREDDIYEEERSVIDVTLNQPFAGFANVKLSFKDIFAKPREFKTREGIPYKTVFTGTSASLQLSLAI